MSFIPNMPFPPVTRNRSARRGTPYKTYKHVYMENKAAYKSLIKKTLKSEAAKAGVDLKSGCKKISYKGSPLPPIMHTKMHLNQLQTLGNPGIQHLMINNLWDIFRSGAPNPVPGWYHGLMSSTLYNNSLVYGIKVKLTIFASNANPQTTPFYVVVYPPSEQDASATTTFDQVMVIPGVKYKYCNAYGSGANNTTVMKWKVNCADVVANDYDVSYSALFNAAPTNGVYQNVQYYDATTGANLTTTNTISQNYDISFDVALYGFKYPSIT